MGLGEQVGLGDGCGGSIDRRRPDRGPDIDNSPCGGVHGTGGEQAR